MFGQGNSSLGAINSGVGDILGLYSGLSRGGVTGDAQAAIDAGRLANQAGLFGSASGGIGQALGAAAIPLSLYNEINSWESGSTGNDALGGASTGAAIGSVVPGIGTALGALIGGAAGALSSLFGPGKKDPETAGVQNIINAVGQNPGQAQQITSQVQDPYLGLAGLFDERSSTLPMYQQYGRMGEQKFTNDMINKINSAFAAGTINKSSTPEQVYDKVVAPWVGSMGQGWSNVGSTYKATTQGLLQDMVSQYMSGQAPQDWKAIGGDSPFSGLAAYGSAPGASSVPYNPVAIGGSGASNRSLYRL